jgi:hypothetical protein
MIDDSALLKMIAQMQEGSNPPHLVPFIEIHRAVHEETLKAIRHLVTTDRISYHRLLNDYAAKIK